MAVLQGLCKNCGSLVMYNSADEMCDCIFCNAVFPIGEVIPVDAELKDIVFPMEKFERKTNTGAKNQFSTMPDRVTPVVERNAKSDALDEGVETKQFEIQAKDVKAPKKVVAIITGAAAVCLLVTVVVSFPLYKKRTEVHSKMEDKMHSIVENIIKIDETKDADGNTPGYSIQGISCQKVSMLTGDEVDETTAELLFNNYCSALRSAGSSADKDDVELKLYSKNGIYTVKSGKAKFSENKVATETSKKK